MKAYIISFYQQEVSDDEVAIFLQSRREVLNLKRPLPNMAFVVSDRNASSLAELIRKKFPQSFFIVAEYDPYNSDGALPGEMWKFLNNPKPARRAVKTVTKKRRVVRSKSASEREK
jgi:hypothetical protein